VAPLLRSPARCQVARGWREERKNGLGRCAGDKQRHSGGDAACILTLVSVVTRRAGGARRQSDAKRRRPGASPLPPGSAAVHAAASGSVCRRALPSLTLHTRYHYCTACFSQRTTRAALPTLPAAACLPPSTCHRRLPIPLLPPLPPVGAVPHFRGFATKPYAYHACAACCMPPATPRMASSAAAVCHVALSDLLSHASLSSRQLLWYNMGMRTCGSAPAFNAAGGDAVAAAACLQLPSRLHGPSAWGDLQNAIATDGTFSTSHLQSYHSALVARRYRTHFVFQRTLPNLYNIRGRKHAVERICRTCLGWRAPARS